MYEILTLFDRFIMNKQKKTSIQQEKINESKPEIYFKNDFLIKSNFNI